MQFCTRTPRERERESFLAPQHDRFCIENNNIYLDYGLLLLGHVGIPPFDRVNKAKKLSLTIGIWCGGVGEGRREEGMRGGGEGAHAHSLIHSTSLDFFFLTR
jgi:hypothetical protein